VRAALLIAATLVASSPAFSATGSSSSGTLIMDDGVAIAYSLVVPAGAPPSAEWPAIVLPGRAIREELADIFVRRGYAVLSYETRGHGTSGGVADFAGRRDVADLRAMHAWLSTYPGISGTAIGAWGESYSGGLILNALAAGVPLAAADVSETWTDLYTAFWPQAVAKTLPVGGLMAETPTFAPFAADAVRSRNLRALRPLLAERSSLPRLRTVRTPVFLLQGRVDWLFDIAQAQAAFARLGGPKKLYVGSFGHVPSPALGVSPDSDYVFGQGVAWFDRFLRGIPNGIETPAVELARSGATRAPAFWNRLPRTRTATFLRPSRVNRPLETWGGGTVGVTVTRLRGYTRLVAVVHAGEVIVTHGAIKPRLGRNVIRLGSYCVLIPKGARLRVTLGPNSRGDVTYAAIPGETVGSISLGPPTLRLAVLREPVSGPS
jgi:hypothetical protein